MATEEINEYYDITVDRPPRDDLKYAIDNVTGDKIAIDCGCGAGSDIAFLRDNGFKVHAFDIESESITRCKTRFHDDDDVILSQASFASFNYPSATLITADASLFFCPKAEFDLVWRKIQESLLPGGIFRGGFLGPKDTMASKDYDKQAFWRDVLTFEEMELRAKFDGFDIIKFDVHDFLGKTAQGVPHHWHIFSVVAKKTS